MSSFRLFAEVECRRQLAATAVSVSMTSALNVNFNFKWMRHKYSCFISVLYFAKNDKNNCSDENCFLYLACWQIQLLFCCKVKNP